MYLLFIFLLVYGMFNSCETIIPGSRLLDFPNPDFSQVVTLTVGQSYAEVNHNFGSIPFHVRVYATTKDGNNANFAFEGTGVCQNDLQIPDEKYGGVIFAYDKTTVKIWTPKTSSRNRMGSIIFVGGGWGGNKYQQISHGANIFVQAWRSGPLPTFETQIDINTKVYNTFKIPHLLQQLPEMVSIRVHSTNGILSDLYFHAVSAAQAPTKTRMIGGVIFAYNVTDILIWTPNKPKTGCVGIGKKWGKGKAVFSQNCYINVRLWINSFPPPIFQTDWLTVNANDQKNQFLEFKHNVKLLPTYVQVQYRYKNTVNSLVFEGSGSIQTSGTSTNRYGGVLFAYDKLNIRIWLPSSPKKDHAYIIFIGDGWGDKKSFVYNATAELRVQIFVDKCKDKTRVVDAQGYCRDVSEIQLIQKMSPWEKCTNPCGKGLKERKVEGCNGRSLHTVINCNFADDNCGFRQSGFNWTRSTDPLAGERMCPKSKLDEKQIEKSSQFLKEVETKEKYFIYSNTKSCIGNERWDLADGRLISEDLKSAEGCILTFKYAAESYYGKLMVQALPSKSKEWKDDLWFFEDGQVRKGIWHSAYIDIGHYVGPVKKIRFIHRLPYSSSSKTNPKCPERCHTVLLTNITLKCEKTDIHVLSKAACDEKQSPLSSCIVNAFKPFRKGPAWSVAHDVKNKINSSVGSFVMANGKKGDEIASYMFDIKMFNVYHLWFDSFANDNSTNAVTFEINDKERYSEDLIYTGKDPLWLPLIYQLPIQAGKHIIRLYQKEKYFKFRNLMISPKNISVYSALGMQSHLIPDNNFRTLGGISTLLGFSRLNGKGAWIPSDSTKGKFYLEIQFPDIALVNKIVTQGGKSLGKPHMYMCWTDSYKMKFSLDRHSFAYYRKNIKEEAEYEFKGNADYAGIIEHKLSYTLVARAIRIYPYNYTWQACLRIEIYGFYMVKGMCPELITKTMRKNCTGDGNCIRSNRHCVKDIKTNSSECDCNQGYHGFSCDKTGCNPNPCKNSSICVVDRGSFKCHCKPGFYGTYCEKPCPKKYYGINCNMKCQCNDNEYCHPETGDCSCLPGYIGPNCKQSCPNNTYGQDCLENCACQHPLICDHINGDCFCPEGFTGDHCEVRCENGTYGRNCSKGCKCLHGGICDPKGKCDCPPGWFSNNCEFPCPDNRYGKMCSHLCHKNLHGNSTCNKITGILTCAKGFKGDFCDKVCSEGHYGENCAYTCDCVAYNTKSCSRYSGKCICKPGWTGERCGRMCENTFGFECKHKCLCKNGGTCNNVDGSCTCLKGHNGTHCESECLHGYFGLNCANRCVCHIDNTDKCDPASGRCSCKPGHEGALCENKCDRSHYGMNCDNECTCLNDALCDSVDGYCYCTKGYEGDSCEKKCNQGKYGRNCLKTCDCRNGGLCERFDGKCDCQPGFHGESCEKECEDGSFGKLCKASCTCHVPQTIECDHVNGSCSCKPGFQGVDCEHDCDDGLWGNRCKHKCQPCRHSYDACNKMNGNCSCIEGFTGLLCMDDCKMGKYGPGCSKKCSCDEETEICDNMDGQCYTKSSYIFVIDLLINRYTFNYLNAKEDLKENLALLIYNCFQDVYIDLDCTGRNASNYTHVEFNYLNQTKDERKSELRLINSFFVRIVDIKSRFSVTNQEVTTITFTLLNNTKPVNGSIVKNYLSEIPTSILSEALKYDVYKGDTIPKIPEKNLPKWIVIGLSGFGGLLTIFLICFICRCTKRAPYPPPFQKVRRDSKDFELQPSIHCNAHVLAFENPYYDVIAAMGFDDIEEDYYNPLYDNMLELQTDSETEPEDMYYSFRNNNYRHNGSHYPYDKDSGFSSGTIM